MIRRSLARAIGLATLLAGVVRAEPGSTELHTRTGVEASTASTEVGSAGVASSGEYDKSLLTYFLDGIRVRGNTKTRPWVVLRYVPFEAGGLLSVDDPRLVLARYRLLGTGFFRDVDFSLEKGSRPGHVFLVIHVVERNTLVVNELWMGLAADTDDQGNVRPITAFGGADAAELNLAGSGVTLGGAVAVAQDQLALRVRFFDPTLLRGPWMTSGELLWNDARDFFGNTGVLKEDAVPTDDTTDHAVVTYKRFGGSVGLGRDLGLSSQLWLQYRLESISDTRLPLAASHLYGGVREPIDFGIIPGRSLLSTIRLRFVNDTRDRVVLTTSGSLLGLSAEVSLVPFGSDYPYQRSSLEFSHWFSLVHQHVLSLNVFAGAISGDAPFFEQFYVGDLTDLRPGRVLGLNFDSRPAPNFLNTVVEEVRYGDYAAKVWSEYRIPLYRGTRSIYGIDFFVGGGVYAIAAARDITRPARNRSGFALLPIDLTANFGFLIDTNVGGFSFSFGNIIGFIPQRSDEE